MVGPSDCIQEPSAWVWRPLMSMHLVTAHVSACQPTVEPVAPEDTAPHGVRAFPRKAGLDCAPEGVVCG